MAGLSVLILAAGKGVRMKSSLPKVLHPVGGIPMVERVVRAAQKLKPSGIGVVLGHEADRVKSALAATKLNLRYFSQKKLDGSGGAVRTAMSWLRPRSGVVLVTCGDTPLLQTGTLQALLATHRRDRNLATVLTADVPTPFGYGRIVRGFDGKVQRIVEELDASTEERRIHEINTGTYVFDAKKLVAALPKLSASNQKKEYYLTDVLEIVRQSGGRIGAHLCDNYEEAQGVNSRVDLAKAESALRQRTLRRLMEQGVTVVDPNSTYVDEQVVVGADTVLWPQTFLQGNTWIGSRCQIGPWSFITDCEIENDVVFRSSFGESSRIQEGAKVGPFSRVRPGSNIGKNAHLGNFSEVKNTRMGEGSKAHHLSYLGDASLGKNVNIGAGTITCNYDGIKKSPTFIQDQAFIGSNVNLIAPVTIGAHSVVGAGSSIARDVPAWALAVERAPVAVKAGWAKKKFSKRKKRA